jgi:hypothetical protein
MRINYLKIAEKSLESHSRITEKIPTGREKSSPPVIHAIECF